MDRPVFYFDPTSPYSWMASERIGDLIPDADWRPVYTFGLFKLNGRGPWFLTDERAPRMAEIEQRAAHYGLPPVRWPNALTARGIDVVRAAAVAREHGREAPFAIAAGRTIYTEGTDPSDADGLRRLAEKAGLDGEELVRRVAEQDVKDAVRANVEEAHSRRVPGVPAVVVGDEVFWGDDRLDEAAASLSHA